MRLLLIITLILSSSFAQASTIKLNYSVFFGYMKTMYKLDYQYVTTAFYLVDRNDKNLCAINNAQMQVERRFEPILFEPEGRLLPYYSDQDRKDGGMLVVDINDGKNVSSCDLQITVMAKERELADLNEQKLILISEQLEGVLKKNAGMIGKYFLPTYAGVRLQLSDTLNASQRTALGDLVSPINDKQILLHNDNLAVINKINELNLTVVRITPWMLSDQ
ncbi:DUF2987 domain-containing protein [Psychromonas sp. RZ22]|uniref:DUF2987 domain-containing protein n=1 Tax=Psychromonas algarum TaxID=2555643 RepID=UPI0010672AD1|nr:DUF2987 domain-containing protein [Psychromonas sp. RZ22]TEW54349.1 DUF2987 domain-containing protein [Psychromonas sp. RZ22]